MSRLLDHGDSPLCRTNYKGMGDNLERSDNKPHSHVPYGVDGSGHFFNVVPACEETVKQATPLTLYAVGHIPMKSNEGAFVICDYGTADGGSSMSLIRDVIDKVQGEFGENQQVHVIYEDQPVNDFKSLLFRIHGFIPDPPSYLIDHKNVFVSFCGTNFYSQCLPDNSVHLGFSANAMQWLSKRPCSISGGEIFHLLMKKQEQKRLFAQLAAVDWETVLLHRAKEMKPGGQMIIIAPAVDDAGQYFGNTNNCPNLLERLTYHWGTMFEDGRITQEELDNTSLNLYFRTTSEFSAPFIDSQSPVRTTGLKLISIENVVIKCPFQRQWSEQGSEGVQAYAHRFVEALRAWGNYTFFSALSEDRSEDERSALCDEFYQRLENEVANNPLNFAVDYVEANIHIAMTE